MCNRNANPHFCSLPYGTASDCVMIGQQILFLLFLLITNYGAHYNQLKSGNCKVIDTIREFFWH